jgi:hypothetical protein
MTYALLSLVLFGAAPVRATVASSLATASDQVRQLAFDGNESTYFLSQGDAGPDDAFTLTFDATVAVERIVAITGRPGGEGSLDAGTLEGSDDGQRFVPLASFERGTARAEPHGRKLRAVRLRPTEKLVHALAVREIEVASEPPVATFAYPVEFVVNVADAPEMKEWAENAARVCERVYPMINDELRDEGFTPARRIALTLKKDYRGVAATSGRDIVGSVRFFKDHPDDVGAMVHETVHVVQAYGDHPNPGWLVEGVDDYIRFFKFEPGKLGPIDPKRAHYDGSYRVTAAFLAYLTENHNCQIVRKLNSLMRAGHYTDEAFRELTGKTLRELDDEWRATLRPR